MSLLRRLEETLDSRLRALFGGSANRPGAREGIELYRDALDQIARRSVAGKRGERIFPFDLIAIELKPHTTERKAVLETLFEAKQLMQDIQATFAEERIAPPAKLAVNVHYADEAEADLTVRCEKTPEPEKADAAATGRMHELAPMWLITLAGVSSNAEFYVDRPQVNIGRVRDAIDGTGRAIRRNDLYFPEGADEANATVSRSHAHLRFEAATGEWRIYDDGSSLGTAVFRDGRRIEAPAHSPRGVLLLPGDEIYVGQARLLFAIPR
jgi:hypothetical protein